MNSRWHWLIPAGLIGLSVVPAVGGASRLSELASDAAVTPGNARFFAAPVPVVVHIVAATVFSLLGALQFAPSLRRRRWHRRAGRAVLPAGLAAALSGLWMTVAYDLPASDNALLAAFRLLAGTGMAASLVLGFSAIRRREIAQHRAWMMRGYALGLGAGTQVLTHFPWFVLVGKPSGAARALLMGAGWAINVAIAEWFIHVRAQQLPETSPTPSVGSHVVSPTARLGAAK